MSAVLFPKMLRFFLIMLCLKASLLAASVGLDDSFRAFIPTYNNELVSVTAMQPDGKLLVAGNFEFVNGINIPKITRLNPDGSPDPTFNQNCCLVGDGDVTDIKVLPDGKILIRGSFNNFNGLTTSKVLLRLNADGTMDNTFRSDYNSASVGFIKFQSDGKLIVSDYDLNRFNADGTRDTTFTITSVFRPQALAVMPNDKIVVAGDSNFSSGAPPAPFLRRFNANGTPDIELPFTGTSFTSMQALPDGKLLVGTNLGLFRYNADGTIDSTFPQFIGAVYAIKLTADNKILVGGSGVRRYLPDGTIDPTFHSFSTTFKARQLEIQPDGKIIAAGLPFALPNNTTPKAIFRLEGDGLLDETYNVTLESIQGIVTDVTKVKPQPDGKVLALGFYQTRDTLKKGVVRLNRDGSVDAGFTPFLKFPVYDFALQPDGKILISANSNTTNPGQEVVFWGRLNTDGTPDNSFNSPFMGSSGRIQGITLQPNGKILLTGYWNTGAGSNPIYNLVRLNPDGSIDSDFNIVSGFARDKFSKSFLQPNGQIITYSNEAIARYNNNGSLDTGFSAPSGGANDVDIQKDGKLLVANNFRLIRLNINGTPDNTFTGAPPFNVVTVKVQKNNKILVGGYPASYQLNSPRKGLARLNPNGYMDWGFNPATSFSTVYDIELQADDRIILGGGQMVLSGYTRFGVSRLTNYIGTPFDYDGDGQSDISVFRPSNRYWYRLGSQSGFSATQFGTAADKLAPADFDADGRTDLAVFSPTSGAWRILRSSDNTVSGTNFGTAGDLPRPGDFDGDGRADFAVWRPSDGTWYWINSSTGQFNYRKFGTNGDIPLIADFDVDGKSDIAVFRPSDGYWHLIVSSSGIPVSIQFGANGDIPTVGDFDGDGRSDMAVWRPSNGVWYQRSSYYGHYTATQFGRNGDIPAVGDYDGDGISDIAVWRPGDGVWYLLQSHSGFAAIQFGTDGDMPVSSAFVQ